VEITGCDSVVFTVARPQEVFAHVRESVLARWPAALVDGFDERPKTGPEPLSGVPAGRLRGHLLFYRDAAMAWHASEFAYVPMADGDGPFAVIGRLRRGVEFEIAGLNELRAADRSPGGPRPPKPYRAWLCSPEVIEVTAVTPGDPMSHAFSSWVLGEVKRACGMAGRGYLDAEASR
jgi:hypothetical protein